MIIIIITMAMRSAKNKAILAALEQDRSCRIAVATLTPIGASVAAVVQ
jgi:hypothetical protein